MNLQPKLNYSKVVVRTFAWMRRSLGLRTCCIDLILPDEPSQVGYEWRCTDCVPYGHVPTCCVASCWSASKGRLWNKAMVMAPASRGQNQNRGTWHERSISPLTYRLKSGSVRGLMPR